MGYCDVHFYYVHANNNNRGRGVETILWELKWVARIMAIVTWHWTEATDWHWTFIAYFLRDQQPPPLIERDTLGNVSILSTNNPLMGSPSLPIWNSRMKTTLLHYQSLMICFKRKRGNSIDRLLWSHLGHCVRGKQRNEWPRSGFFNCPLSSSLLVAEFISWGIRSGFLTVPFH